MLEISKDSVALTFCGKEKTKTDKKAIFITKDVIVNFWLKLDNILFICL